MSDAIIIILDDKEYLKGFLTKDNKVVDKLEELCIMPYIQAAELESKLHYTTKRRMISLKDLLMVDNVQSTDLINNLVTKLNKDGIPKICGT